MVCVNGKRLSKATLPYAVIHLSRWEEDGYTAHIVEKSWIKQELVIYMVITKIIRGKSDVGMWILQHGLLKGDERIS